MMKSAANISAAIAVAIGAVTFTYEASAQGTLADKALRNLLGKWVSDRGGRTISFRIRDNNAVFEDEIEPGVVLTGAYRQDDSGAGYVLRYSKGFKCRYNISIISGGEGNKINLRLVSEDSPQFKDKFRCINGTLNRTRQ